MGRDNLLSSAPGWDALSSSTSCVLSAPPFSLWMFKCVMFGGVDFEPVNNFQIVDYDHSHSSMFMACLSGLSMMDHHHATTRTASIPNSVV